MRAFFEHNGELTAVVLAAVCAWAIAAGVLHFAAGTPDSIYVPGIAAVSAAATTWCLWRLIVAYGERLLLLRGMLAGGLAGVLSHPVFMFAVLLRDAIAACNDTACITDSVLTAAGMDMLVTGSGLFSIMGLAMVGPITVPVGALGGMLAVVIGRGARRNAGGQDEHGSSLFGDSGA